MYAVESNYHRDDTHHHPLKTHEQALLSPAQTQTLHCLFLLEFVFISFLQEVPPSLQIHIYYICIYVLLIDIMYVHNYI
jgi:hypothetical protein